MLPAEGNLTDAVAQRWPMVKSLIQIEHEVSKSNAQPKKETRYYISSLDFNDLSAREVAYYIYKGALRDRKPPSLAIGYDF